MGTPNQSIQHDSLTLAADACRSTDMSNMEMQDPKRLFMLAAVLILAGALVSLAYRLLSHAKCDPTIQVVTFAMPSAYNTPTEYRVYEHGRLLVLDRGIHRNSMPFAIGAMVGQYLLWVPAVGILLMCRGKSKSGRWERAKADSAWSEQERNTWGW